MVLLNTILAAALGTAAVFANPVTSPGQSPVQKRGINPPGTCGGVDPVTKKELTPVCVYNYDVGTGAIDCNPAGGKIYKANADAGHHITTLATFEYTSDMAGKQCQVGWKLAPGAVSTGSQSFQLFSSLSPAPGCTSSWPPGNQRDQQLATATGVTPGGAPMYLTAPVPCEAAGVKKGYELVGVNDNVLITWADSTTSGPRIYYW
jgi:hypothetical protein